MQFSHALRALPVVCSLAPALVTRDAHPAASPDTTGQAAARYRVATDAEWFYQEVTGKRLALLARRAVVAARLADAGKVTLGPIDFSAFIPNRGTARAADPARDH